MRNNLLMIDAVIYGFTFGAAGFLVASVLTQPGEVLDWWPALVRRVFRLSNCSTSDWNALQWAAFKTTYGCAKCVAGQIGLWASFLLFDQWGQGVACVVLAIFSAYAIERYYE